MLLLCVRHLKKQLTIVLLCLSQFGHDVVECRGGVIIIFGSKPESTHSYVSYVSNPLTQKRIAHGAGLGKF
jgi:hypothetical protein